jgi:NAD-dependent dihydropyrimidine dehydrogenase PreA subunit
MFNSYTTNTLLYDAELCINCGKCWEVCPQGVFVPDGKVAKLVNLQACIECGACMLNCPVKAIVVESGVGCAAAMINAALRGQKMESGICGCADDTSSATCNCG